jgi:organic radical activating enzyme
MDAFIISLTNTDSQGLLHSHRLNLPVESSVLTKDEVILALKDIKGIKRHIDKIVIMGGEPFDWHHDGWTLADVIIEVTKAGFPVEVVTNGNFFLNRKDTIKFIEKIVNQVKKEVVFDISADVWHGNYSRDDNICYPIENLLRILKDMLDYSFKIKVRATWLTTRDPEFNMPDKFKSYYRKLGVLINEKPLVIEDKSHHLYEMSPLLRPASLVKDELGRRVHTSLCQELVGGITDEDKKVFMLMSNEKIFNRCLYHRYLCANGTYWSCYAGEGIPSFRIGHLGEVSSEEIEAFDKKCPFFGLVRRKGVVKVVNTFLDEHPEDRSMLAKILNANHPFSICGYYGCSVCKTLAKEQVLEPIGREVADITDFS